eukprot:TRINITY_DN3740_c0_g1_i3.p1 TRINITY_DN3740_c0_g1~~TRINITY_DN3740_c0_g1_i3.p1  ORF type:complete len:302 (+),score=75.38 TRINITY_DN3740_c0_g1_i3:82-987(+)
MEPTYIQDLRDKGWAVVKGAVPADRAEQYYQGMWDFFEGFGTGLDRRRPATWKDERWPAVLHGGLMQHYAVGHEQFVWDARCEPGVIDAFARIWNDDKLLVSFDGINLTRPGVSEGRPWPHTDQSGTTVGFHCAQGVLNLLPNGPEDGGLIVHEGSHLMHEAFFQKHPERQHPSDWCTFSPPHMKFFEGCKKVKVCGDPGDLFLFDSRTVHYACAPTGRVPRAAIYICMTPANLADPGQIKAKKHAFLNKRMTSHWPHKVKLFELNPKSKVAGPKYAIPDRMPVLTDTGARLAGIMPYERN